MSELTKEWLQQTIAELEEERDATPGAVNEDAAMSLAAMRLALASLEAESVAFRSKLKPPSSIGSEHWDYTDHRQPDAFELESCVIERLFTEPPAPVAVPDEIESTSGSDYDDYYCDGWNACRAAMLQGAEGNSPVIPDGWVACSERMPEAGDDMIVFTDDIVMSGISYSKKKGFYIQALEYDDDEPVDNVTHWMPLPAAPQQEVAQALAKGMERYGDAMLKLAKKEDGDV
ncbi:DUF551 domain-containing protein [Enterobacter hormaechei]